MSRAITNDHPFTDDEKAYLVSRGRQDTVALNAKEFPPGTTPKPVSAEDDSGLQLDQDIFDHVKGLSDDELKSELLKAELHPQGDSQQMKVELAQHLQLTRDQTGGKPHA